MLLTCSFTFVHTYQLINYFFLYIILGKKYITFIINPFSQHFPFMVMQFVTFHAYSCPPKSKFPLARHNSGWINHCDSASHGTTMSGFHHIRCNSHAGAARTRFCVLTHTPCLFCVYMLLCILIVPVENYLYHRPYL